MAGLADLLKQEIIDTPANSPKAVQGTGGGLADMVPATIEGEQPAALSEGEFVFPADVVSMLGDGSTEAGSRILTKLIDKIRVLKTESTGRDGSKQAKSLSDLIK